MPEAADEADSEVSEADNATTEGQEARPRSRWQRRRAAARARREAERQARLTEGAPESGSAANPPLDIAALLPDLPPRRPSPNPQESLTEPEARAEEDRELPS